MKLRLNLVILLLLIFTHAEAQRAESDKKQLQIDSLLSSIYKSDAPGVSISIVEKGKLIFKKSYGLAELEAKTTLNSKTNFNIGSLTKQFTALAILQLAESKKLQLDDHLDKFFPGLNKKVAKVITIKQLLTHSSGLIDHYELTNATNMKHAHMSDVLNAIINTDSTYFAPGTDFRYSNTAYCLLSLIIEKISGLSYAEYLKKNIFMPAGMKQTVVWNEKEKIENEATGYEFDSTANRFKRSGANENIFFSTEGDGGIYSSAEDYMKWFTALQSGKVFPEELIRQARSSQFLVDKEEHLSYGYGWFINDRSIPSEVFHSGSNGGFRAFSFSIPAENFLIIILSNRDDVNLEKLIKKIYTIVTS